MIKSVRICLWTELLEGEKWVPLFLFGVLRCPSHRSTVCDASSLPPWMSHNSLLPTPFQLERADGNTQESRSFPCYDGTLLPQRWGEAQITYLLSSAKVGRFPALLKDEIIGIAFLLSQLQAGQEHRRVLMAELDNRNDKVQIPCIIKGPGKGKGRGR